MVPLAYSRKINKIILSNHHYQGFYYFVDVLVISLAHQIQCLYLGFLFEYLKLFSLHFLKVRPVVVRPLIHLHINFYNTHKRYF